MLQTCASRIGRWGIAALLSVTLPACMDSPETDTAMAVVRAMADGDFQKAESYFAEGAPGNDGPESAQVFWTELTDWMGSFKSITTFTTIKGSIAGADPVIAGDEIVTVSITCQFELGSADIWMSFSEDGKLTAIHS